MRPINASASLQALVNAPARRLQDEADIRALLEAGRGGLRMDLIRDYYRLFDREADLHRLLEDLQRGQRSRVARTGNTPLVGCDVAEQRRIRAMAPARDLDEFLAFLARLRALAPRRAPPRPRPPTTGHRFLL